ncbi:helix-turn-helix domain-containing protein [Kutzneria sp. 744]|uniref:AlbA family DNA-binding domain-containing protein n=1 Tax=Kutzneria sp. (strain 744) TaxID=345341 RepID=UPI0003EECCD8|nr:ATP-binding protein [Kutzneria sp. 744]EWM13760.1 hypothetical protein KUTG_04064 [Kutzneria sp. 744]
MDITARPTRYKHASAEALQMLALGESGRYEFKRDAEAVSPKVLAALANWVALDPAREAAHLLVGVDEVEDTETGLVYGVPCGLPKGLDRAVARLQDMASKIRPIPVDVFIVEESVGEGKPFLRVEVRPTMPPHFDDEGRRQTRQGRSTRALTDDELLHVYLDREAGTFSARFRHTAVELRDAVGAVGAQVDQITDAIDRNIAQPLQELTSTVDRAAIAASDAEAAASAAGDDVANVEYLVRDLQCVVEELQGDSPESLVTRVAQARRRVWWAFTVDTWKRSSNRAERISLGLQNFLSTGIRLDSEHNSWELRVWNALLSDRNDQRGRRGTLKWWEAVTAEVDEFLANPIYQPPKLPDLRTELRTDLDTALDDPNSLTNQFKDRMED